MIVRRSDVGGAAGVKRRGDVWSYDVHGWGDDCPTWSSRHLHNRIARRASRSTFILTSRYNLTITRLIW